MRRALILASVTTLAALTVPSPAGAQDEAPETGIAGCVAPEPTLAYDTEKLAYGMEVDLGGCQWWEGGDIELSATVFRLSADGEEGTNVQVRCGEAVSWPEGGEPVETPVSPTCGVDLEMEHPPVKGALYQGEIEYPWEDGTVTVDFEAFCASTPFGGACTELPSSDPSV